MQNKINLAEKEAHKHTFFLCCINGVLYARSISSPYTHNHIIDITMKGGRRKFERYERAIKIIAAKFTYTKSTFSPHKFH